MSQAPLTKRDYQRAIKAIAASRREVQQLIDATRRDEQYILSHLGPMLCELRDARATLEQLRNNA